MRKELLDELLPMNRKERYFTGTVLPMIICDEGLEHLGVFTKMCGCEIDPVPPRNVQFFTEYNLKESISADDLDRFREMPIAGDTPDVLIVVGNELIAIEAKMYHVVSARDLNNQMERQQKRVLRLIETSLCLEEVHHVALLPQRLAENIGSEVGPAVIHWESVLSKYKKELGSTYFLNVLQLALDRYEALKSKPSTAGRNADAKIPGQDIFDGFGNESFEYKTMGRGRGGTGGGTLQGDVADGTWHDFPYEVSMRSEPANSNWTTIEEFVRLINEAQRGRKAVN